MKANPRELQQRLGLHLGTYDRRVEAAVRALASATRQPAEAALAHFRRCRATLEAAANRRAPAAPSAEPSAENLAAQLPTLFEFVLTLAERQNKGFAFLTQGHPSGTLPENMQALLEGVTELELTAERGAVAGLLIDLFRLHFPKPAALRDFSGLALALLVGFVPTGEGHELKLYFNTRLGTQRGYREAVSGTLARLGIDAPGLAERVLDELYTDEAVFYGTGVDLDAGPDGRLKLYFHYPRTALAELAPRLERLGGAEGATTTELLRDLANLLRYFDAQALTDTMEIAVALSAKAAPACKVTLFCRAESQRHSAQDSLFTYLRKLGYPVEGLRRTLRALAQGCAEGVVWEHALHAIALEPATGGSPRLNVYLHPVL